MRRVRDGLDKDQAVLVSLRLGMTQLQFLFDGAELSGQRVCILR